MGGLFLLFLLTRGSKPGAGEKGHPGGSVSGDDLPGVEPGKCGIGGEPGDYLIWVDYTGENRSYVLEGPTLPNPVYFSNLGMWGDASDATSKQVAQDIASQMCGLIPRESRLHVGGDPSISDMSYAEYNYLRRGFVNLHYDGLPFEPDNHGHLERTADGTTTQLDSRDAGPFSWFRSHG